MHGVWVVLAISIVSQGRRTQKAASQIRRHEKQRSFAIDSEGNTPTGGPNAQSLNAASLIELSQAARSSETVFERFIEKAQSAIAHIFTREPDWEIFGSDFKMTDEFDDIILPDLASAKQMSKLLRMISNQKYVKDFEAQFTEDHILDSYWHDGKLIGESRKPVEETLMAKVRFRLAALGARARSSNIEALIALRYDELGKITAMEIQKVFANGHPISKWPHIDLSHPDNCVNRITEWLRGLNAESVMSGSSMIDLRIRSDKGVRKTMQAVKADLANILKRQPRFGSFSEMFSLAYPEEEELVGLPRFKLLCQLVREMHAHFAFSDVDVNFQELYSVHSSWKNGRFLSVSEVPGTTAFVANVELLANKKSWLWSENPPVLDIELELFFFLDHRGRVGGAKLERFAVNGWSLNEWPEAHIGGDPSKNLPKIVEWFDMVLQEIESVEAQGSGELHLSDKSLWDDRHKEWS